MWRVHSISTLTRLFKPKTFLVLFIDIHTYVYVLFKVCPHHTDMILGPCSQPFSQKNYEQFSSGRNRVYPPSSGDSIIKCGSCTYSTGKLENKSKKVFIYLKKRKKKKKNIPDSVHVALQYEFCSQPGVETKHEIGLTSGML